MSILLSLFSVVGAVLLFVLRVVGVLLLVVVVLLLCPFCADVCWQDAVLTVRAGAWGITFPVLRFPKPEPPAVPPEPKGFFGKLKAKLKAKLAARRSKKKAAKPPAKKKAPRKKAKLTVEIVCTVLRGAGQLMRAVFGALRFTKIRVRLGVRGEDPAAAARTYGKLNAWLYTALGFLDRFVYLDFEELRLLPDFGTDQPTVQDVVSFRVSARALCIVIAAVRVLYEFWRKKVLDVLL